MPKDLLSQALFLMRLKQVKRTGWVRSKISYPESVAAHSFGTAALTILLLDCFPGLNGEKLVRMAILHDIGEAATGTDTVADRGSKINWRNRRKKAAKELGILPRHLPKEYVALYREMEDLVTPESKAIKEIEKLDMALTAFVYEERTGKNLQEFYDSSAVWIKTPELVKLFESILRKRKPKKKAQLTS